LSRRAAAVAFVGRRPGLRISHNLVNSIVGVSYGRGLDAAIAAWAMEPLSMATESIPSGLTIPGLLTSPAISGVAVVATGTPGAPSTGTSNTPLSTPASTPAAPSALQTAVASAASSQAGLSGLLADLTSALQSPGLPTDVQAAAAQILGAQLALDPPPTAQNLQQAIAQSGLFLEAQLAQGGAPPDGDLKAALLNLIETLEASTDLSAPAAAASTGTGLGPPYAGAPLQGQPPATPLLTPDAALEMIAALLTKEAKGALSRQVLMQAASLPKSAQTSSTQAPAQRPGASWLFELLFAAPDGPAVAQFEIDRDGEPPHNGAPDSVWRVRFSLDFAPIGPIHARISLSGGQAHVALWAENEDTRSALDAQQADLANALLDDELTAQVAVFQGQPNVAPAPAGQFMNRAV
jgi:hypothetical protein